MGCAVKTDINNNTEVPFPELRTVIFRSDDLSFYIRIYKIVLFVIFCSFSFTQPGLRNA